MVDYPITSDFSELDVEGSRLSAGFRPSGELHVGNLLTLAYAAVVSDELDLELDLFCCDTDWSAHIHENHKPDNGDVMKLFFERDGPEGFDSIAEYRVSQLQPFLQGVEQELPQEVDVQYLSDLAGDEGHMDALREVLNNMEEFDEVFGGAFRRRYVSPVAGVCSSCGFSHSKGSAYSSETDELVTACRNQNCSQGFSRSKLTDKVGVYYLVDPVRDVSRDVAVHVFGGDYRDAEKGQKTSKAVKVAKITELACGETPQYFLAPLIADEEGLPLSKSKGTGATVSEIDDLEEFGRSLVEKVREWLDEEKKYVSQSELKQLDGF